MEKLPSSASISITTSEGKENISTVQLKSAGDWVYLDAKNFTFSSPTLRIKLNQTSSATTQSTGTPEVKEVKEVAAAKPAAATAKKKRITCTKGKLTKKLSGTKPKCPTGFKRK